MRPMKEDDEVVPKFHDYLCWRDGLPLEDRAATMRCHVVRPASVVHNDLSSLDLVCDQELHWGNHDSWSMVSHWAACP